MNCIYIIFKTEIDLFFQIKNRFTANCEMQVRKAGHHERQLALQQIQPTQRQQSLRQAQELTQQVATTHCLHLHRIVSFRQTVSVFREL